MGDHSGPACYELRIRFPFVTAQVVYAGETKNLSQRMNQHDVDPSDNLRELIDRAKFTGRIDYHYLTQPSKQAAVNCQDRLLGRSFYHWNISLNDPSNPPRDPSLGLRVVRMSVGDQWTEDLQRRGMPRRKQDRQ